MTHQLSLAAGAAAVGLFAAMTTGSVSATSGRAIGTDGQDATRCAALKGQRIAGATIEKVAFTPEGTPTGFGSKSAAGMCRAEARISPAPGSTINIVILMPSNWNGKFAGSGGGGFDGGFTIAPVMLRKALAMGFAGVATDAGHDRADITEWALNEPERIVDYGHRANHLGAVVGKAVVTAYYGAPVKRSFFQGCSNGGRDALMLAQRYPMDYDVIAAGAPAYNITKLFSNHGWVSQVLNRPGVNLTAPKLKMVHNAVVAKCDAIDGVKDGLVENPLVCGFDPATLQCKPGQAGDSCLSNADLGALSTLYRGSRTRDGRQFYAGFIPGGEYDWPNWTKLFSGGTTNLYRYFVYNDPKWDFASFDLLRDYAAAEKKIAPVLDASATDLRPFLRRGGRLMMYHGWDDTAIPAGNTLEYYARMRRTTGRLAADRTRLFMVPGMGHCFSGNGPDYIDYFATLDRWDTTGVAPERIIASKFDNPGGVIGFPANVTRTRPLCAWPKTARYQGSGSIDEASNFACVDPRGAAKR